ncbi:hypothetical protein AC477_01330 [miscellaneous Crenarchaeota group-1 archaeon SG8-32-1]|uniref:GOLD domain-containing protein n=1 Tax=miscellaneous Crenarchaeota group-1 archaeon SG8-32-1 TaxID=1685124 RepID=A0A0M0BZ43_9ARCH|nr:MAG: hypothetical protein AC477_01330 [miscellaneous Crenarchaeota group-1 archaeon SG8-32-1]
MMKKKFAINFLIGFMLITFFAAPLSATTLSINMPAGEQVDQIIDLKVNDHVKIQFNVLGTDNSYISFSLVYPNSTEVNFGDVGLFSYNFISDMKGEYKMCFVNNDLTENKLVTLNYQIEPYMFGMPQTQFLIIVIAVICVMMVAFYSLLSPHP